MGNVGQGKVLAGWMLVISGAVASLDPWPYGAGLKRRYPPAVRVFKVRFDPHTGEMGRTREFMQAADLEAGAKTGGSAWQEKMAEEVQRSLERGMAGEDGKALMMLTGQRGQMTVNDQQRLSKELAQVARKHLAPVVERMAGNFQEAAASAIKDTEARLEGQIAKQKELAQEAQRRLQELETKMASWQGGGPPALQAAMSGGEGGEGEKERESMETEPGGT